MNGGCCVRLRSPGTRRRRSCGRRSAYGFVNDLAALSHHPALRRTPVAAGGGVAQIVAPAVIRVGDPIKLGGVPGVGQNSARSGPSSADETWPRTSGDAAPS